MHSLYWHTVRRVALVAAAFARHSIGPTDRVVPNDNRVAAGVLRNGVLTLRLEAREATWYPDGDAGPSLVLPMFAEAGRAARNPGPMIRVAAGTKIHVFLHNALRDSVLVVYGLHTRPSALDDTIQVRVGATREISFAAGAPGTYFYWGTTTHKPIADRSGVDSQLQGAFIIDAPGRTPPTDRVFVLGSWASPDDKRFADAELRVINGVSWPQTERFSYTVGDTVRWRWVNPTDGPHPMHLHGFFFDIGSRGSWAADTVLPPGDRPHVVTEMPLSGGTFTMTWVPDEPGQWLFHCHVAFHTSLFLAAWPVREPDDPVAADPMKDMSAAGMRGMVLGVTVKPGQSSARRSEFVAGARALRLVAQAAPKRWHGQLDEMAFVRQDGDVPPAADSVPTPSSPLILRRGEPVSVTIVNHTRAPTGVHWHGLELPSYQDGVPGWSGLGSRTAPMIAPGDSFVAAFTPTRSGTFMYHAHSNETYQISLGLYGALVVVDSAKYDATHERIIIIGADGPLGTPGRINGRLQPDTVRLRVGETYRIRLIEIMPDYTIRIAMMREDSVVHWKALAKDGAELPLGAQVMQRAEFISGPGQTMDFEYRPTAPGLMLFHVRHRVDPWKTTLPIRVER